MTKPTIPTEAQEQTMLFRWAEMAKGKHPELALLYHIANGGSRNVIEARHLKEQGVKPGVPDICLPVPRGPYHALYIEMKRKKGGRVSDEQRGWLKALDRMGNMTAVCYGMDEARQIILSYLELGKE